MRDKFPGVLAMALVLVPMLMSASAVAAAAAEETDPLFASHDVLAITLSGPIRSISRDKSTVPEYQPGTLTFAHEGEQRTVEIGIRPRGKSRRDRSLCSFPPLRLDLPKKAMAGTVFDNQNKLKLVTHCQSGKRGHPYVYREYLAYRMLNLLTPDSFKVRLLTIDYVDEDRGGKTMTQPGFLIEHKKRLAKRRGAELGNVERLNPAQLDPAGASLAELYQFLISNTDFSFIAGPEDDVCCHNAVLLLLPGGQYLPVPYDFDVAGLIDAPYAVPQTALGQDDVKDRVFRGFCRPQPYLADAVARMHTLRDEVYAVINGLQDFNERHRQQVVRFVENFYAILDDDQRFERKIGGACRG